MKVTQKWHTKYRQIVHHIYTTALCGSQHSFCNWKLSAIHLVQQEVREPPLWLSVHSQERWGQLYVLCCTVTLKVERHPYQRPTAAARNPSWEFHVAHHSVTLSRKLLFIFRHCPFSWNRKDKELSYWLATSRGNSLLNATKLRAVFDDCHDNNSVTQHDADTMLKAQCR